MYLKSLVLRGFKSFATTTTLKFEPGINCVVGPNGSGKSNVVDALAWVMGEQGAKNLRGGQMADVIFAGTAKRPALGRAEVSLTIDNTSGILPIEYNEVTISRTLFRSGGSEYAINGTACRLLDIQELLSDTGMGKEMHVIIGQGKLDEVLTATAEERRNFIEEAAGVLKHQRRKEKALRKMESMQANLVRIEDLATELRRQLGPLAKQAATARRAQTIQREVFDAKARLLADDLAQAQARQQAQQVDDDSFVAQQQELAEKLLQKRAQVESLQLALTQSNPKIAELTEYWQRLNSIVERFRGLIQLAQERQRSLEQSGPNILRGESPEQIRKRAAQALAEENELRELVAQTQELVNEITAARETAELQEREIDAQIVQLNRMIADRRETVAQFHGQLNMAKSKVEALEAEIERVKQATENAKERVVKTAFEVAELEEVAVANTVGDDTLSIAHEESARQLQAAKDLVTEKQNKANEAATQVVQWRTKAETLALSLTPEDATAWLVNEYQQGVLGLVQDQLKILPGWEAGVEAALAGIATGAVMDNIADAVDALRAAREAQSGHLEILVASTADDVEDSHLAQQTEAVYAKAQLASSVAILAKDAVLGTNRTSQIIKALLQDTILVVDLVTAKQLLALGAPRVATLAGDVLTPLRVLGGEVQQNAVLARFAAYDDARLQVDISQTAKVAVEQELAEAVAEAQRAEADFAQLTTQLNARDSQLAAVSAQLGVLRQSLQAAEEEVERNQNRYTKLEVELEARKAELEKLQAQEAEFATPTTDFTQRLQELQDAKEAQHQETVAKRAKETELKLQLRTREERLRAVSGKADSLENTAKSVEARIAQEERMAMRRASLALESQKVAQNAQKALQFTQETLYEVTAAREVAERERVTLDGELAQVRTALDALVVEERTLADLQHRREMALAQLQAKYEQLVAKAIDELGLEPDVLIEEYGPHQPVVVEDDEPIPFVRQEQEKRLARAERDLVRLGKVNPLALEEHQALEERQKYLTEQLHDLRKSREDLWKIVRDIDQRVKEVMHSAFADVAKEFTATFARLFPGGEGKLVLTDPDDILHTGIEIEARPPGKRVKRLSLLSGGERSLTAVAFLVAIFKARPSPFYVMDEVEAALDDVNLSRLIDIFKELQDNSQLLVITHQKRTMEIADTLYGVAMKEQGVTSVISQRLKELEIG